MIRFLVSLREHPTVLMEAGKGAVLAAELRLISRRVKNARNIRHFALVILVTVDVACGDLRVVRVRPVARKIVNNGP